MSYLRAGSDNVFRLLAFVEEEVGEGKRRHVPPRKEEPFNHHQYNAFP